MPDIIPEPTAAVEMGLDQLVPTYLLLREKRDEVEAAMAEIAKLAIAKLDDEGLKGTIVGDKSVTKQMRVSFKTTLTEARELGATAEAPDKKKLKQLYDAGAMVPGVSISEFLRVSDITKKEM